MGSRKIKFSEKIIHRNNKIVMWKFSKFVVYFFAHENHEKKIQQKWENFFFLSSVKKKMKIYEQKGFDWKERKEALKKKVQVTEKLMNLWT